jgi:alpha-beta hydrolase superfamily lysophospholipase
MRERTSAEVDVVAVHRVADRFGASAELIDGAVGEHLARLAFGGAGAGRAYTARGDALRAALQRLAAELSQWSRTSADVAVALRASADRYADAELYAAERIA